VSFPAIRCKFVFGVPICRKYVFASHLAQVCFGASVPNTIIKFKSKLCGITCAVLNRPVCNRAHLPVGRVKKRNVFIFTYSKSGQTRHPNLKLLKIPVSITPEKIKEIAQELDCGMKCFYHVATREIESYPDELKSHAGFEEEFWQDVIKKVRKNLKQYISFEGLESHESFRMMETFIANIDDDKTRGYFEEAIGRRKPFQQFKACLHEYNGLQQLWYQFKNAQLIKWVEEQLAVYNLKPSQ
jgi:hypothetical protein